MVLFTRKWLIQKKVFHLLAWLVVALFVTSVNYDPRNKFPPQFLANLLFTGITIPICYIQYYWLVPDYLYKRKFTYFVLLSLIVIITGAIIDYLVSIFIYHLLTGLPMFPSVQYVVGLVNTGIFISLIAAALGLMIRIIENSFQMERRMYQVEKDKINTELNFLRSQVNPHFLFNILNTIYFQIDRSNMQARSSVETLSEMLRYQLYDCTSDKINIEAEVEYIKNYVAMQTLRMEKGSDVQLSCNNSLRGFYIAPLLLLPVIENAFKHVSNYKKAADNRIHISLDKQADDFVLNTFNTYDNTSVNKYVNNAGGLGMQNLERRLRLLYPDKYLFLIDQKENTFNITLKIKYDDQLPGN